MRKVLVTLELMLGDLAEDVRADLENDLEQRQPDIDPDDEDAEELETIPYLADYDDEEIKGVMYDVFGDHNFADPDNCSELFAGSNFYGSITGSKVLAVSVETVDDGG